MSNKVAISVKNLTKDFKLPHEKPSGIKQAIIKFKPGKEYEMQHVLRNISFDILEGEFFGIVGRNGSGKSTLLKTLAQIYTPNKGEVNVQGSLTPFIELGVGFNPELTGRENVFLNGALLGFDRKQVAEMYDDIVEFAEIERFMDQKLKNYSSGMQVRLAFSIAIRAKSDILLLDEVLAVGDAAFQRKCYDHFMELKKANATVVLVTHDMNAIRQYCDRAIMIEKGKITKAGTPEEIAQEYQRLFVNDDDKTKKTDSDGTDRWGNGKVLASRPDVRVTPGAVIIRVEYVVKQDVESLITGFTIHGPSGLNILEDNTLRHKIPSKSATVGDKLEYVWEIPNIFSSGKYSVSVACCDLSTTVFYDWLNAAVTFDITKEMNTAGVVSPSIKLLTGNLTSRGK